MKKCITANRPIVILKKSKIRTKVYVEKNDVLLEVIPHIHNVVEKGCGL